MSVTAWGDRFFLSANQRFWSFSKLCLLLVIFHSHPGAIALVESALSGLMTLYQQTTMLGLKNEVLGKDTGTAIPPIPLLAPPSENNA